MIRSDANRVVVVGEGGVLLECHDVDVRVSMQDKGRTMKVFVFEKSRGCVDDE